MYHPPSRRQQLIKRTAIYSLMTFSVVVVVTILMFIILGYQFNREDGTIEQGGLVQFGTKPDGANVIIDGIQISTRTNTKSTLSAGNHIVSMQKSGYEPWNKTVDVKAGTVLWLNYARLVPSELAPRSMATFDQVSSSVETRDRKTMAIQTNSQRADITLADLSRDDVTTKKITIPVSVYSPTVSDTSHNFKLVSWGPDNKKLLVEHQFTSGASGEKTREWIVVDTNDVKSSINVTSLIGLSLTKVTFSTKDNELYVLEDDDLRKISLDGATISRPLVKHVAEYSLFGDDIITFTTQIDPATGTRSVGYFSDGASVPRMLRSYSDKGKVPLHFALARYYGKTYEIIAYDQSVEILQGELSKSDSETTAKLRADMTLSVPNKVSFLDVKTNGRFIVMQHKDSFSVYDQELDKLTTTSLKSEKVQSKQLEWIDEYNLYDDQAGVVRLYEFDGANQHATLPVVPGQSVTLSQNGKYLYGFNKDKNGRFHLSRVQMMIN